MIRGLRPLRKGFDVTETVIDLPPAPLPQDGGDGGPQALPAQNEATEAVKTAKTIFTANLKKMPGVAHLEAIRLLDGEEIVAVIEHKAGQLGSLTLYNHLSQIYGAITPDAARAGLELYAEYTEEARANPGKHPHIDRLLELAQGARTLRVKHVFYA